jgi:hypothetical protein
MSTLRTITGFKERLAGGGARPNLFEISIPVFPPALGITWGQEEARTFNFLCKAAAIPGSTINPIDIPFRGRSLKLPGDRTFAPWTITIINDEDFRLHSAFMQWMNAMNKLENATGATSPSAYMVDAYVNQLGRGADRGRFSTNNSSTGGAVGNTAVTPLRTFKLYDMWPSDVGEIPLSYESDNTVEEYTVEFQYQWNSAGEGQSNNRDQTGSVIR